MKILAIGEFHEVWAPRVNQLIAVNRPDLVVVLRRDDQAGIRPDSPDSLVAKLGWVPGINVRSVTPEEVTVFVLLDHDRSRGGHPPKSVGPLVAIAEGRVAIQEALQVPGERSVLLQWACIPREEDLVGFEPGGYPEILVALASPWGCLDDGEDGHHEGSLPLRDFLEANENRPVLAITGSPVSGLGLGRCGGSLLVNVGGGYAVLDDHQGPWKVRSLDAFNADL